jgi:hypothetical protein
MLDIQRSEVPVLKDNEDILSRSDVTFDAPPENKKNATK